MFGTRAAAGLLFALGLCALTNTARAGDTVRLDLPGAGRTPATAPRIETTRPADTHTLDARATDSDIFDIAYRGYRGGYHGGYRGGYGGGVRVFVGTPRYYGYGGYYRPYYYPRVYTYGYYRPYYQPRVYTYGAYYYPPPVYVDPCSLPGRIPAMPPAVTLRINPAPSLDTRPIVPPGTTVPPGTVVPSTRPMPPEILPTPRPGEEGPAGTFPYDGGPRDPVPMPGIEEAPATAVPSFVIRPADRLVSLPEAKPAPRTGKWTFPAYGEEAQRAPKTKPAGR